MADIDAAPHIPIRHHDDDLVVVSKPAGMLVHRDFARGFEHVLLNTVRDQIGARLYPVHRLDRNTSGLVAFALSSEGARRLQARLADEATRKAYLALVRGAPPDRFAGDRPLRNASGEPRPALTRFETVVRLEGCALVRAELATGRHRQIRRHLNHLAHQVIGDTSHGKGRINRMFREEHGLPRMFLHAWKLELRHPTTDHPLALRDPLPPDLAAVLARLDCPGEVLADVTAA